VYFLMADLIINDSFLSSCKKLVLCRRNLLLVHILGIKCSELHPIVVGRPCNKKCVGCEI
jgi:hypothetical protein